MDARSLSDRFLDNDFHKMVVATREEKYVNSPYRLDSLKWLEDADGPGS